MFKSRTFSLVLLSFVIALTGCSSKSVLSSKDKSIAARVNGEIISGEELKNKLVSTNFVTKNNKEEEQKKKREALEDLITDNIVDQMTAKLDLSQDKDWQQKKLKHDLEYLVGFMYIKEITENVQVQDSEVVSYYEENKKNMFTNPEQYKVSHILVTIDTLQKGNPEKAESAALEKIDSLYRRASDGEDFGALARSFSADERTGQKGGELGYLPKGRMIKEFEEQVTSLDSGEVSKPFRTKYGYHIIQYTDKKPEEVVEFNQELKDKISAGLTKEKQNEKAKEFIEDLKNRAKYLYNEEVLKQNYDSVKGDPWVLITDDVDTIIFSKFTSDYRRYQGGYTKDTLTLDDKKKFLRDYSSLFNVLLQESKRRGYDKHPDYLKEVEKFSTNEARRRVLAEGELKSYPATDGELYDYYLAHREEFPPDSSLHVYHIIFTDSLEALKVLEKIQSGADFVEMAKQYYPGAAEIRDVAYDLGFITELEMSPEFYKAAAQLQVGEVCGPVKTEWGYHLIKLAERREGSPVELYKARLKTLVKLEKEKEKKEQWEKEIRKGQDIWINEKVLQKMKIKPVE
ncbi:MAG: peptidylprolyl isomerase [candidate division Zixibacteria bacterium]|nr:peptidylprolyl isomerase [candidate division Zixibacteria bacterium]